MVELGLKARTTPITALAAIFSQEMGGIAPEDEAWDDCRCLKSNRVTRHVPPFLRGLDCRPSYRCTCLMLWIRHHQVVNHAYAANVLLKCRRAGGSGLCVCIGDWPCVCIGDWPAMVQPKLGLGHNLNTPPADSQGIRGVTMSPLRQSEAAVTPLMITYVEHALSQHSRVNSCSHNCTQSLHTPNAKRLIMLLLLRLAAPPTSAPASA
jgi:hypothetical protein